MSTVDERRIKLQEINASIDGVRTAPERMPDRLSDSMLPCAITYPGPAVHRLAAVGYRRETRSYVVRLYVRSFASGKDTDQNFQACLPFLESVPKKYLSTDVIAPSTQEWELLSFVDTDSDGGVGVIPLHGTPEGPLYWGIVFEVELTYKETL